LTTISRQILCKQAGRKNYVPSAPLIKEKSQGLIPDFVYSLSPLYDLIQWAFTLIQGIILS